MDEHPALARGVIQALARSLRKHVQEARHLSGAK